jgi:hypothetical protein
MYHGSEHRCVPFWPHGASPIPSCESSLCPVALHQCCVLLPCTSDTYDHSPMTLTDVLIEFVTTTCKVSMVWNEVPLAHCIGQVQLVCDLNMSQTSLKRRLFGVCGKRETVCRATWFVDNRSVCQGCGQALRACHCTSLRGQASRVHKGTKPAEGLG